MPPAPFPTPWKDFENRDQSWELWTASLWHHFGSSEYHRSLRFHASLPSQYKILPVTLCPEDVYCLNAQSALKKKQKTKKKHSSCCTCLPVLREGNCTLCDRCHKKWIHLEICCAAFCFLPSVGPWQRYLMNPDTSSFIVPRAEGQGLGRDCAFGKPALPQS